MALLQTLESLVNVDRFSNPSSTSTLNSESTHRLRAHVPLSSNISSRPAFPITAHDDVEHKKLARLPPGFRYQPKLSELAYHFLPKVLEGCSNIAAPVCHVDDVFNYHPVQLSGMRIFSKDIPLPPSDNYYFVSSTPKELEQMHLCISTRGALPVRFAAGGSWRATRPPSIVYNPHQKKQQREAIVTTYRFYKEGTVSKLTEWRLHEFSSRIRNINQVRRTLCHLHKVLPSARKPMVYSPDGNLQKHPRLSSEIQKYAPDTLEREAVSTSTLTHQAGQNNVCILHQ